MSAGVFIPQMSHVRLLSKSASSIMVERLKAFGRYMDYP